MVLNLLRKKNEINKMGIEVDLNKRNNPERLENELTPIEYAEAAGISRQAAMHRIDKGLITSRKVMKEKRVYHFINIKNYPVDEVFTRGIKAN